MNSITRVIRSLDFQPVDRVARFDDFWPGYRALCQKELNLGPEIKLTDYFAIDIIIAVPDESTHPNKYGVISQSNDEAIYRNKYGAVVRSRKSSFFEEELEFLINDHRDLERFPFEQAELNERYSDFLDLVNQEQAKGKCVFGKIGGPFIRSTFIRGKENFLMDIAADEGFARELAGRMADFLLEIGKEELKRADLSGTGIWIYDDMGYNHGPLMSPKSFERIFYPLYRKMVSGLKAAGANKVCLHSDGDIRLLLDMLIDAGIDAINPVEPRAGMSIRELRRKYGRKLAYIGGMCNSQILINGPLEQIWEQAGEIIEIARDGGVIIGAHSIGLDIPVKHYLAYHEFIQKNGVLGPTKG